MRASAFMAGDGFARLRRRIAEIEGRPRGLDDGKIEDRGQKEGDPSPADPSAGLRLPSSAIRSPLLAPRRGETVLPFGVPLLDRLLRGGLRRDALHEIRSETMRTGGAATGFAMAILARLMAADDRPVLFVIEAATRETGLPYGPGLSRFGLDPRRLVVVRARKAADALWVFEEGLRCRGLAAVLAEVKGHPRPLDLTASRRLALRARESGVMGVLLRQAGLAESGAAETRFLAAPRPATTLDDFSSGIGRPAWRLVLERNRAGTTAAFDLEWNHDARSFALAEPIRPALSVPGAPLSPDRPHLPAETGAIVAFASSPRYADGDHREGEERVAARRAG